MKRIAQHILSDYDFERLTRTPIKLKECERLADMDGKGFTIAVDDGYVAYKQTFNLSHGYSIQDIFRIILKHTKKQRG